MRISASPQIEEVSLGTLFGTGSNKANSVKHQYYNKVTFLQFSAYKTNQQTSICLSQKKMNKKMINLAKTHQNDLILRR